MSQTGSYMESKDYKPNGSQSDYGFSLRETESKSKPFP
jgi:hypothetical protein